MDFIIHIRVLCKNSNQLMHPKKKKSGFCISFPISTASFKLSSHLGTHHHIINSNPCSESWDAKPLRLAETNYYIWGG